MMEIWRCAKALFFIAVLMPIMRRSAT